MSHRKKESQKKITDSRKTTPSYIAGSTVNRIVPYRDFNEGIACVRQAGSAGGWRSPGTGGCAGLQPRPTHGRSSNETFASVKTPCKIAKG